MTIRSIPRRRVVLAGCLGLALSGLSPAPASATADARLVRLSGPDRFATSIAVSLNAWPQQATSVVLARADAFPDALAGTPLAVAKQGPLLLTGSTALPTPTSNELKRVLPGGSTVYLLGGTSAISDSVRQAVINLGYRAVRLSGPDRYATATAISRQIPNPTTIFEATGQSFPYALVAGVAAAKVGGVVVLTNNGQMPTSTRTYLNERQGIPRTAVGPEATAADPSATSVNGTDKYDTARLLAAKYFPEPATVGLASGTVFADALAGGAHIGRLGGPLLLSEPGSLPASIRSYFSSNTSTISRAFLYGGTSALTTNVEDVTQNTIRGAAFFGEGTHRVGSDIAAGTYRTRRDNPGCYWERLAGFSGSINDVKANSFSDFHQVVTITPEDAGFTSRDCGIWTSDLSPLTSSQTAPFGNGMWIVNTDIAAATWTAPGGESCYWARLSDFTGGIESIIANSAGATNPVVTIASTDVGFESSGCGQWRQVQ